MIRVAAEVHYSGPLHRRAHLTSRGPAADLKPLECYIRTTCVSHDAWCIQCAR